MIMQVARAIYLLLALGLSLCSHQIVRAVRTYKDGKSQEAILIWFGAMRVYGALLALNMALNIIIGGGTLIPLCLAIIGAGYLLYALRRFLRVVLGW